MGFFQTFWTWLNNQLTGYIGDNTARVSAAIEPAVVTLAVLYVMAWGYLQLTGRIEDPLVLGLKRILTVAAVLGVALRMWLYNAIMVDTFYQAPVELVALIIGASDPVHLIDSIWDRGGLVAGHLWSNGAFIRGDFGYDIAGIAVWVLIGLLCVYTLFLLALSRIALAILLALGPFFVAMLLFERTRRLFDAWLAQLANYALVTILTVMATALLLRIVDSFAAQTAALGSSIATVDVLNMLLVAVLVFLLMRQVMPIASALAGGAAFNTFGTVSRAVGWSAKNGMSLARRGARTAAAFLIRGGD